MGSVYYAWLQARVTSLGLSELKAFSWGPLNWFGVVNVQSRSSMYSDGRAVQWCQGRARLQTLENWTRGKQEVSSGSCSWHPTSHPPQRSAWIAPFPVKLIAHCPCQGLLGKTNKGGKKLMEFLFCVQVKRFLVVLKKMFAVRVVDETLDSTMSNRIKSCV